MFANQVLIVLLHSYFKSSCRWNENCRTFWSSQYFLFGEDNHLNKNGCLEQPCIAMDGQDPWWISLTVGVRLDWFQQWISQCYMKCSSCALCANSRNYVLFPVSAYSMYHIRTVVLTKKSYTCLNFKSYSMFVRYPTFIPSQQRCTQHTIPAVMSYKHNERPHYFYAVVVVCA